MSSSRAPRTRGEWGPESLLTALSSERRRIAIRVLAQRAPLEFGELVDGVVRVEKGDDYTSGERKSVYAALNQSHRDKLADADVINVPERESGIIQRGSAFEAALEVLDTARTAAGEMTSRSEPVIDGEDVDRIRTLVDRVVRSRNDATPVFYAVTGSHMYGFPDEDSDFDVRGFHVVDDAEFLKLDGPREQFAINRDGTTEGFEAYADVDFVSYELKKFGSLLYAANFNALETVFEGIEVVNGAPLETESLRTLVREELPMDVPETYYGMARSNYSRFHDPDSGDDRPSAKTYLYVIRGLLAGEYVRRERDVLADVTDLAEWWGDDDLRALVDDLIAAKRAGESPTTEPRLASRADDWCARLFDEATPRDGVDKTRYRERLNDWMLRVRA